MPPLLARLLQTIAASGPSMLLLSACTEPAREPGHPTPTATTATASPTTTISVATPPTVTPTAGPTPTVAPTASTAATPTASPAPRSPDPRDDAMASLPASWGCAQGACSCFAPNSVMHSYGLTPTQPPPYQHHYDSNGCAPLNEVTNGCCNPATKGPMLAKGQCCYQFQQGACCGRPLRVGSLDRVASIASGRREWG